MSVLRRVLLTAAALPFVYAFAVAATTVLGERWLRRTAG